MHSEEHGAPIVPREVTSFAVENKNLTRDSSQDNEVQYSCVRDIRTVRYSIVVSGISGQ